MLEIALCYARQLTVGELFVRARLAKAEFTIFQGLSCMRRKHVHLNYRIAILLNIITTLNSILLVKTQLLNLAARRLRNLAITDQGSRICTVSEVDNPIKSKKT